MGVLSNVSAVPGGKPFEPFGKDSICSEGGSTGRRTDWPCRIKFAEKVKLLRPSVQLPAGIHGCAVYKDFARDGKGKCRFRPPFLGRTVAAIRASASAAGASSAPSVPRVP